MKRKTVLCMLLLTVMIFSTSCVAVEAMESLPPDEIQTAEIPSVENVSAAATKEEMLRLVQTLALNETVASLMDDQAVESLVPHLETVKQVLALEQNNGLLVDLFVLLGEPDYMPPTNSIHYVWKLTDEIGLDVMTYPKTNGVEMIVGCTLTLLEPVPETALQWNDIPEYYHVVSLYGYDAWEEIQNEKNK